MPARPPLHPPSRRLALLLQSRGWSAADLAAAAGLPIARIGAALHGGTTDPHLIAARLALPIGAVLAVLAAPTRCHTLRLATVNAILDGAPPLPHELVRIATVFGFDRADALNDASCPRCATVGGEVTAILCWRCGWRVRFPQVPPPPTGEAA